MRSGTLALFGLGLALLIATEATAQSRFAPPNGDRGAWLTLRKNYRPGETPMVTPNGTVVPYWAARRIAASPVPLVQPSANGSRPWAYALAHQDVPSAYWATLSQGGFGAGPIPGFTNGPPLGNIPSMPMGPTGSLPPRFNNRTANNYLFGLLRNN